MANGKKQQTKKKKEPLIPSGVIDPITGSVYNELDWTPTEPSPEFQLEKKGINSGEEYRDPLVQDELGMPFNELTGTPTRQDEEFRREVESKEGISIVPLPEEGESIEDYHERMNKEIFEPQTQKKIKDAGLMSFEEFKKSKQEYEHMPVEKYIHEKAMLTAYNTRRKEIELDEQNYGFNYFLPKLTNKVRLVDRPDNPNEDKKSYG